MQQVTNPAFKKQCKTKNVFQIKSNILNTSLIKPPVLSPTSKKIPKHCKFQLNDGTKSVFANQNLPFMGDTDFTQT